MLFLVLPTIALLLLLLLLFLLLLFLLTLCARLVVHSSPSAVQAQHLAIENTKNCREEHGQPNHHEQDGQDRGPDPERLRVEDNIAKLDSGVGENTLEFVSKMQPWWDITFSRQTQGNISDQTLSV
jgi:hypothetical protein